MSAILFRRTTVSVKEGYATAYSIALATTAYFFSLTSGSNAALAVALSLVLVVPIWAVLSGGSVSRLSIRNMFDWALFSIVLTANIAVNSENFKAGMLEPVTHAAGLSALFFGVQWCVTVLPVAQIFRAISILLLPLLVYAIVISQDYLIYGRAAPLGVHPNWWGELAFACCAFSLALASRVTQGIILSTSFILIYLVQSRGALLAVLTLLFFYYTFSLRLKTLLSPRVILLGFLVLCTCSIALFSFWDEALLFVRNDLMLLDDEYRGADTGLTGRVEGWVYARNVFLESPIFGNGLDTLTEVHSGFLRLAGEGGLLLLGVFLFFIVRGLIAARKLGNPIAFAIILGYMVLMLTYPRSLNMNLAAGALYMSLFSWAYPKGLGASYSIRIHEADKCDLS